MIDRTKWHRWFAWHPVWMEDGSCAWLRVVERRLYNSIMYDAWYLYRRLDQ